MTMPLAVGATAPDFALPGLDGEVARLGEWLAGGPVVVAFFKTTCPTCMLAFPFLERIHQRAGGLRVLAVSQDGVEATRRFHDDFEITLPTVIDAAATGYAVSDAYGITHVPSLFLVSGEGIVEWFSAGFSKPELEELGQRAGVAVFGVQDRVPVWKPG
ncbi:MAG: TlpA family protein disulfide reductase [Bryobacterales bacterium]|nr:TlpA family protein disulfide reductase [Bryobacterales bacterium]